MASTPRPSYIAVRPMPVKPQGSETDAVMKAIAGLTFIPIPGARIVDPAAGGYYPRNKTEMFSFFGPSPYGVGAAIYPAGSYGMPVYPDMPIDYSYLYPSLEAAAHGPQQSEFAEAVQAFTTAASALREIAENTAKTLAQSREETDTGEWNIKAAKEKLSQVFDHALVQPQRVTRRGGDAVILVEENRYNALTQAAASASTSMLDAFKAPALRGATLPDVDYPEPLPA